VPDPHAESDGVPLTLDVAVVLKLTESVTLRDMDGLTVVELLAHWEGVVDTVRDAAPDRDTDAEIVCVPVLLAQMLSVPDGETDGDDDEDAEPDDVGDVVSVIFDVIDGFIM